MNTQSNIAISTDGVPIHFDVQGVGEIALVFVHGWCCNRNYWNSQMNQFARSYTVVALDVAGHGASGRGRMKWAVPSFGKDIVAVVEQLGLEKMVLIGHSAGAQWIVEAARRLSNAVIGLVGVDAWHNVEQTFGPAQVEASLAPFRINFPEAARAHVRKMFLPTSDSTLVEHVVAAISAAPPPIGIGAREEGLRYYGNLPKGLLEVKAPKTAINSDNFRETNMGAAQRHGIDVALISGVGHFVMMEDPQTFNRLLEEVVRDFIALRPSKGESKPKRVMESESKNSRSND